MRDHGVRARGFLRVASAAAVVAAIAVGGCSSEQSCADIAQEWVEESEDLGARPTEDGYEFTQDVDIGELGELEDLRDEYEQKYDDAGCEGSITDEL